MQTSKDIQSTSAISSSRVVSQPVVASQHFYLSHSGNSIRHFAACPQSMLMAYRFRHAALRHLTSMLLDPGHDLSEVFRHADREIQYQRNSFPFELRQPIRGVSVIPSGQITN